MKVSENYYVLKKKYSKWWDSFREKGHERMTVMFIPHNEKDFQFSDIEIYGIVFVIFFLIVIGTSSYAIIKNASSKREEQQLLMNYKDIRSKPLRVEKLTSSIFKQLEGMKPDIEESMNFRRAIARMLKNLEDRQW